MQSCSLRLLPLLAAGLAACHSVTAPRSSLVGPGTGTQDGMQPYDTCLVTQRLLLPDGASAAHAGRPFGIALSSSRTAFVTLSEHRRLARAELAGAAGGGPAFSQTIAVGAAPTDVALNSRGTRAYVTNRFGGSISIVDVALNRTIGTLGLAGKPWRVKVAPGDSILWATNDAGGIYAYRLSTGHQVAALQAHQPVNGVAVGGNGHAWFGLRNGTVVEVDTRTYRVSRTFTVGGYPQDVALSPDGRQLYVANALGMVQFLDLATGTVTTTIALPGGGGFALALSDDGDDLYVSTGTASGKVWVIDPPERRIEHVIITGGVPRRIVIDRNGEGAVVANEDGFVDIIP